jgi:hypothetical protein
LPYLPKSIRESRFLWASATCSICYTRGIAPSKEGLGATPWLSMSATMGRTRSDRGSLLALTLGAVAIYAFHVHEKRTPEQTGLLALNVQSWCRLFVNVGVGSPSAVLFVRQCGQSRRCGLMALSLAL